MPPRRNATKRINYNDDDYLNEDLLRCFEEEDNLAEVLRQIEAMEARERHGGMQRAEDAAHEDKQDSDEDEFVPSEALEEESLDVHPAPSNDVVHSIPVPVPEPSRKNKRKRPPTATTQRKKVAKASTPATTASAPPAPKPVQPSAPTPTLSTQTPPTAAPSSSVPSTSQQKPASQQPKSSKKLNQPLILDASLTRRPRRAANTKKVSASYYLGYADDEESIQDIMHKFDMLEALQQKQKSAPPLDTPTQDPKVTAQHEDAPTLETTTSSVPKQEDSTLDQHLQEELFRITSSTDFVTKLAASLITAKGDSSNTATRNRTHDYSNSLSNIHDIIAGLEYGDIYTSTSDESDGYYSDDNGSSAEDDYDLDLVHSSDSDDSDAYMDKDAQSHRRDMSSSNHVIPRRRDKRKRTPNDTTRSRRKEGGQHSRRRHASSDKAKLLENVRIYVDLKTNETLAMVHTNDSGGLSPTSILHSFNSMTVNNATIHSLQQYSSTGRNRKPGKIRMIKIPSGALPPTWTHQFKHMQLGRPQVQRFVQDAEFVFEQYQEENPPSNAQCGSPESVALPDTSRFLTSDVLQMFDFSKLPLYGSGQYEAILLSPPWEKWNHSVMPLYLLPLKQLMKHRGYVFIWIAKELIPDVFEYFAINGYTYADNLCWVHQQPKLAPDAKTFFRRDKALLFLFRMDNKATKKMNIRHQRSPDTVFDFKEPIDAIYQMIETFLPTTNKTRLHLWAPHEKPTRQSWTCVVETLPADWDVRPVIENASAIVSHMGSQPSQGDDEDEDLDEEMEDDTDEEDALETDIECP